MIIKYRDRNNKAMRQKWYRMCHNLGWVGSTRYLECGFSSWRLTKDENELLYIEAQTNYFAKSSLDEMYEHNFKTWVRTPVEI